MKNDDRAPTVLTRRRMLARVGLIAGAAYATPAMIGLNAAHASDASGGNSAPSRSNSAPSRSNSGPSRSNSGPSRGNSRPSRGNSGPSRGNRNRTRRDRNETPRWLRRIFEGA